MARVKESIKFSADSVKVSGPLVGGSFRITFETGEYGWKKIKDLPDLNGKVMNVEVIAEDYPDTLHEL